MCIICKQNLIDKDLVTHGMVQVCRAKRRCLAQILMQRSDEDIDKLHAVALSAALLSPEERRIPIWAN